MRRRTPETADAALARLSALATEVAQVPSRRPPPEPVDRQTDGEWLVAPDELRRPVRAVTSAEAATSVDPESDPAADRAAGSGPPPGWAADRWGGSVPAVLRGARLDPGRRGLVALAVVALVAAAVAGVSAWRARPQEVPVVTPVVASATPAGQVVVAVSGRVRTPGLVRLPAGSRVADAVRAAGGALPGANLGTLNLARKLVDGELVVVDAPAPPAGTAPGATAGPTPDGPLVDLNTATIAQLDALPGVGAVLAERIVAYRTERGGFRSVQQLREIEGIGDTRFERLKDLVTV